MKQLQKLILHAFAAALLAVTATACGNDPSEGPSTQLLQQIVTFTGNSADGHVCFQYQALNDSPLVYLRAPGRIAENSAKPGDRLLLTYRIDSDRRAEQGGEVAVTGLEHVLTDTVTTADHAQTGDGLYLLTIQRSGEYLDLQAQMPKTSKRKITITTNGLVDSNGLLTLCISAEAGQNATDAYMAQAWASLWIGPVWQREDVAGVRVTLNNTNNPYRNEFIFTKQL